MGTPDMPPGWYPDPVDDRRIRWWDGDEWDLATRPGRRSPGRRPLVVIGVVVAVMALAIVGAIVIHTQNKTETTPSRQGPVITGTVKDWIAAVCLPNTATDIAYRGMTIDLYQHASTAQRCFNEKHARSPLPLTPRSPTSPLTCPAATRAGGQPPSWRTETTCSFARTQHGHANSRACYHSSSSGSPSPSRDENWTRPRNSGVTPKIN
ncbi:DUF2510 domain-containing protein (plasmid) [Gordonia sp. JH63]|nr:DUF2510 domain-containing protein [Gordonia sp. JH63]